VVVFELNKKDDEKYFSEETKTLDGVSSLLEGKERVYAPVHSIVNSQIVYVQCTLSLSLLPPPSLLLLTPSPLHTNPTTLSTHPLSTHPLHPPSRRYRGRQHHTEAHTHHLTPHPLIPPPRIGIVDGSITPQYTLTLIHYALTL
jgi:hypothetical protein